MRVAIDTNRLTDLFQGDENLGQLLSRSQEVWVPLPVFAELKAGFLGGSRLSQIEAILSTFMGKETVRLLLPTRETAEHYARLALQVKTAGAPIPVNDVWTAALCPENDLTLVTRDQHFQRLPQLLKIET